MYTRLGVHFKHEKPVVRRRHHVFIDGLRRAHLYDMLIIMRRRCENRLHNNVGHRVPTRVHRRHHVLLDGLRPMLAVHSGLNMRGGRRDEHLYQNGEHRVQFDNIVPRRQRLYTRLLDDCGDLSLVYARHVFQHQRRRRLQGEDSLLVPRG